MDVDGVAGLFVVGDASSIVSSGRPVPGVAQGIIATIVNAGPGNAAACGIAPQTSVPASFLYQTTDPTTNALTGTPNTPVTIAGNDGVQTFLLAFQGTTAFTAPTLALQFECTGSAPAAVITGVDTVDLTFSATPVADVIALAATATNNGIVELPNGGVGAFAVASFNVGATAVLAVSVDTGGAVLPIVASICQTNSSTGQCLEAPAAEVTLNYPGGADPTFSIFLQSSGPIAFAPASSRVFVRFEDAVGAVHGSTSLAIETN